MQISLRGRLVALEKYRDLLSNTLRRALTAMRCGFEGLTSYASVYREPRTIFNKNRSRVYGEPIFLTAQRGTLEWKNERSYFENAYA